MKTHDEQFNREILSRLESDQWNNTIAGRVFQKRRNRRMRIAAGTASLATAALILIAILPMNTGNNEYGDSMNSFVNTQLRGTWTKVFANSNLPEADSVVMMEAQYDDTVDDFIDTTLVQRW